MVLNGAVQPSLDLCLRKTTNETLNSRGGPVHARALGQQEAEVVRSPENLIGGDRTRPGRNSTSGSQELGLRGPGASGSKALFSPLQAQNISQARDLTSPVQVTVPLGGPSVPKPQEEKK